MGLLAAGWWGITRSTMVAACTLAVGAMLVVRERRSPGLPLDSLLLASVIFAVTNLYLERMK